MTNNRALEFLEKAQRAFPLLHDRWGWQAKTYVGLAMAEVEELMDTIAMLEARPGVIVNAKALEVREQ